MTRRIASYLIGKKYCDSLVIAGTNGEFYSMSFEEKVRLFAEVKEEVGDRVPFIAGTGTANTCETIELTKEAARLGYDASMVVVPYYCHPTQEGIYYHFSQICKKPIFRFWSITFRSHGFRILIRDSAKLTELRISLPSKIGRN
jgi:4-hydroxy-tetrahydrodipicolinate synthase